jgi:hypothetical protein
MRDSLPVPLEFLRCRLIIWEEGIRRRGALPSKAEFLSLCCCAPSRPQGELLQLVGHL